MPYEKKARQHLRTQLANLEVVIQSEKQVIETVQEELPGKLELGEDEKTAVWKLIEKPTLNKYSQNAIKYVDLLCLIAA